MEYSVFLDKPFDAGISGKMWRLLKDWYEEGSVRSSCIENFQLYRYKVE